MALSGASGSAANQSENSNPTQGVAAFRHTVVERFSIQLGVHHYAYQEYLALPIGALTTIFIVVPLPLSPM